MFVLSLIGAIPYRPNASAAADDVPPISRLTLAVKTTPIVFPPPNISHTKHVAPKTDERVEPKSDVIAAGAVTSARNPQH